MDSKWDGFLHSLDIQLKDLESSVSMKSSRMYIRTLLGQMQRDFKLLVS